MDLMTPLAWANAVYDCRAATTEDTCCITSPDRSDQNHPEMILSFFWWMQRPEEVNDFRRHTRQQN